MRVFQFIYRLFHGEHRIINGEKGVISLFLAILLVPFTMLAGSLVNAARINSAVAVFDEALCNASNSTLGTYDKFLKKRFGLLAMSQDVSEKGSALNQTTVEQVISETFEKYLQENSKALSNTYFNIENKAEGVYPLADRNVLFSQVLEFSKYSVPVKLVEDGISLDSMISDLEKNLPGKGLFRLMSAGAGVADNLLSLGRDFDALKAAVRDEGTAIGKYDTAYNEFKQAVDDYVSKREQMNSELSSLNTTVSSEKEKMGAAGTRLDEIKKEIEKLEKDQTENKKDHKAEIEKLKEEQKKLEEENKDSTTAISEAESQINSKTSSYNSELQALLNAIPEKKSAYSSAISALSTQLSTMESKITAVQNDIADLSGSLGETLTQVFVNEVEKDSGKVDDDIADLEKKLATASDEEKEVINQQIEQLEKYKTSLNNKKETGKAGKDGMDNAINKFKTSFSKMNVDTYNTAVIKLRDLKLRVDSYDTTNITSRLDPAQYYYSNSGRLTIDEVEQMEKDLMKEIASQSIWDFISMITGFFEALVTVTTLWNPQLGAYLDKTYYDDTYHGLPSEKERSSYPLNMGQDSDADLSTSYKNLLGSFSPDENDADASYDMLSALGTILGSIGTIGTTVNRILSVESLWNFANLFQTLQDSIETLTSTIQGMVDYLAKFIKNGGIYKKALLAGYVSYMTSCRTTYTKTCLTGQPFNLRGQPTTVSTSLPVISDIMALKASLESSGGAFKGELSKSFVGAETEYIMFGSRSEYSNQVKAFGVIMFFRVLSNIIPIITNAEVDSIASATAITVIGPFLVYLIYIVLESLVDTIILVNGGNIKLIKNFVFLTPSGIEPLMRSFTSLQLNSDKMQEVKAKLLDKVGRDGYSEAYEAFGDLESNADTKSYLDINYQQTLFLVMSIFTSMQTMVKRLADIIEMEAVTNQENKEVGSDGLFDLDYSYTFIRAEANFHTNEFIKISEGSDLTTKKRIVYRGY